MVPRECSAKETNRVHTRHHPLEVAGEAVGNPSTRPQLHKQRKAAKCDRNHAMGVLMEGWPEVATETVGDPSTRSQFHKQRKAAKCL